MIMTEILPVDEHSLALAKEIISAGGAVAFPTETVYGLGADAFNTEAVNGIFKIKGRPNDNPLIVHVHKDYEIERIVCNIPSYAKKLAEKFLPGPLTMVYKSRNKVSRAVSCGLDTLAIRIPSHTGAQKFLKYLDIPIAAPSANISKHVSPTTAEHVFSDLNGKINLILDGGNCSGGIESTVLDCTGDFPVILRSGLVTREMIEATVGKCGEYIFKEGGVARSPGMKYGHYMPSCRTALFRFNDLNKALSLYDSQTANGVKTCILCDGQTAKTLGGRDYLCLGNTPEEMASNLYYKLREAESKAQLMIAVAPEEQGGVMSGVMNRLTKACKSKYES